MLLRIIAIIFLIVFLLKLLNPKVFPYMAKVWDFIKELFYTIVSYFFKSFYMGVSLLFRRTIYVVGTSLLVALFITLTIFLITFAPYYTFGRLFYMVRGNFIDLYVLSFFTTTYLLGLVELIKQKGSLNLRKLFNLENVHIYGFKNRNKEPNIEQQVKDNGHYYYDEETKQYKYKD